MSHMDFRPFVRIEYFDGEGMKGYWPRGENTSRFYVPHADKEEVVYWRPSDTALIVSMPDLPILFAHGVYGVSPGKPMTVTLASLNDLSVVGTEVVRDRHCIVLTTNTDPLTQAGEVTIYADPSRTGAIVRLQKSFEGRLLDQLDVEYHLAGHPSIPSRWIYRAYGGGAVEKNLVAQHELVVDSADFDSDPSPTEFHVPLQPGMVVLRRDQEFQKMQVGEDGETLHPYVAQSSRSPPGWSGKRVVIIANIIVAAGFVVALYWTRRHRTNPVE